MDDFGTIYIGPEQRDPLQQKYDQLFERLDKLASPEQENNGFALYLRQIMPSINLRGMSQEEATEFCSNMLVQHGIEYQEHAPSKAAAKREIAQVFDVINELFP